MREYSSIYDFVMDKVGTDSERKLVRLMIATGACYAEAGKELGFSRQRAHTLGRSLSRRLMLEGVDTSWTENEILSKHPDDVYDYSCQEVASYFVLAKIMNSSSSFVQYAGNYVSRDLFSRLPSLKESVRSVFKEKPCLDIGKFMIAQQVTSVPLDKFCELIGESEPWGFHANMKDGTSYFWIEGKRFSNVVLKCMAGCPVRTLSLDKIYQGYLRRASTNKNASEVLSMAEFLVVIHRITLPEGLSISEGKMNLSPIEGSLVDEEIADSLSPAEQSVVMSFLTSSHRDLTSSHISDYVVKSGFTRHVVRKICESSPFMVSSEHGVYRLLADD